MIKIGVTEDTSSSDHNKIVKMFNKRATFEAEVIPFYNDHSKVIDLPNYNLIVFSGGEDVSPEYYNNVMHSSMHCNPTRDKWERFLYEKYKYFPKIGICRGAQFLCVMQGGNLIQHLPESAHYGQHQIYDIAVDRYITVTSSHHQACLPKSKWNTFARGGNINTVEGFFIEYYDTLGVQFHPEWGHKESEDYFFELIERYLGDYI